ncbi:MAG: CARDB domain-containing protein [Minisyncoccia bacterium]
MTKSLLSTLLFTFVLFGVFSMPGKVGAESASWSTTFSGPGGDNFVVCSYHYSRYGIPWTCNMGFYNPSITVTYQVTATNADTGVPINPRDSVPVGTNILFSLPHTANDLPWLTNGVFGSSGVFYDRDSGVVHRGQWEPNARGPWAASDSPHPPVVCEADDYVHMSIAGDGQYLGNYELSVNPPTKSIANSSGLTCEPLETGVDGNNSMRCVVTSAGALNPQFKFASTYGKFYGKALDQEGHDCEFPTDTYANGLAYYTYTPVYYDTPAGSTAAGDRYIQGSGRDDGTYLIVTSHEERTGSGESRDWTTVSDESLYDTDGTLIADNKGNSSVSNAGFFYTEDPQECWGEHETYCTGGGPQHYIKSASSLFTLTVPSQTISYPLTATDAENLPPNPPTITGPTTGTTDTSYTFSFTATDPDGDNLMYEIDWNRDNVVDELLPATGFVETGTSQSSTKTWTTTGKKDFKARAKDQYGLASTFTPYAITLGTTTPTAPIALLTADPSTIAPGGSSTLRYSCGGDVTTAAITPGFTSLTPVASGTRSVTPTDTTTYTLTCTGPGGSDTDTAILTVSADALPDLTASITDPGSVAVNTDVTLSGIVSNTSTTAGTDRGFTNLFQIDNNSDHNTVTAVRTDASPALAANDTDAVSTTYRFTTTGTWYIRLCADNNTSFVDVIDESNEGNNCSDSTPWVSFTVTTGGTSLSCTASPGTLTSLPGTVTYSTSHGESPYTWNMVAPSLPNPTQTSASITYTFPSGTPDGNYAMEVTDGGGNHTTCLPNVSIATNPTGCNASPIALITASPTRVKKGSTTTLTWSADGIPEGTTCTISGPGFATVTTTVDPSCTLSDPSSGTATVSTQSTYTITCGSASDSVVVDVVPDFGEF